MESGKYSESIRYATAIKRVTQLEDDLASVLENVRVGKRFRELHERLYDNLIDQECELVDNYARIVSSSGIDDYGDYFEETRYVTDAYLAGQQGRGADGDWLQTCYDEVKRLAIIWSNIDELDG